MELPRSAPPVRSSSGVAVLSLVRPRSEPVKAVFSSFTTRGSSTFPSLTSSYPIAGLCCQWRRSAMDWNYVLTTIRHIWYILRTLVRSMIQSNFRNGDKVRIKVGEHAGQRGLIVGGTASTLTVSAPGGDTVTLEACDITNYSAAARKAWKSMPKKSGRPPAAIVKRRVSLRIDSDLWDRLAIAVERGTIRSREQAVNDWLRERLSGLQ